MQDMYVKERERSKIPDKYKWDLGDIYPDDTAWQEAKKKLLSDMPQISGFKGKLSGGPEKLQACLDLVYSLRKEYVRLACYAGMRSDMDTRNAEYLAMDQEMGQIGSDFTALYSFIEPEILKIDAETISRFLNQESGLEIYRHILDDILRKKDHTGTEGEEKIIAEANLMADSPVSINNIFSNADFPYPEVDLQDGTSVRLDPAAFSLHRRSPVRDDRRKVFAAYLGKIHEFRRTFGAQLSAEVRKNLFFTRARDYGSCLERALDVHNIPVDVYKNLIAGVHANLETLHRYLGIRKRLLGLDDLHYYDLYAPVVKEIDLNYAYEEAVDHVLASLEPLGTDYLETAREALSNRWIDVYHNDGKRSGAYSNGSVYDAHPYMLLNYNGKYDDVSTLTHELGHTMHSFLTNRTQPYALSNYSIFVAEVASTFNEALLLHYMLEIEKREEVRLSLLCNYLDNARATVYRQAQFAEFELKIHEAVETGTALTGDLLDSFYETIARKYYGHEQRICIVDDEIKSEWAYIPHFYYNFYVYQYATSYTASAALSERVLSGDGDARAAYLNLLASGGCDYPIELLKKVGVDMTTSQPLEATLIRMNRIMDEIEKIAPA
ncbi:MAG: oligoendopeptidase F [Acidobacteria bacterium]|nr:oligoendopeptidase F [Acidobacteriota bacterium]